MDPGHLDTTPTRPPPPGRTSDFTSPESRSYQLYILIAFLTTLVALLISLRLYTRLKITRSFGADDWLCIAATIFTISYSGLILKLLWKPGGGILGIHLWDVPLSHYVEHQKGSLADSILIRVTSTTIKVAFLVFYLRLFGADTRIRYMAWAGIAVLVLFCVVFVAVDAAACAPWPGERGGWLARSLADRCDGIAVDLVTAGAYFNVVTDFYILFVPLHRVPGLRLSKKRKIGVSFIFLTGLLAVGAGLANSIVRSSLFFDRSDFTWTIVPVYATSLVEINVGLLCHSMPIVSVLFASRFKNLGRSLSSWIRERRSPRPSPHQSPDPGSSNLAPNHHGGTSPHTPSVVGGTGSFSGMRRFIRNIYRSDGALDSTSGKSVAAVDGPDMADRQLTAHSNPTRDSREGCQV